MNFKEFLKLTAIFTVFSAVLINVNAARRVILRPLSAEEVVRILKIAGREDAVPEGRVITQGFAAMTGFALGLTKGIGGSLLFDLATSNATTQFINNFNASAMMGDFQGINMTAFTQMFKWGSGNNASAIKYKRTEICFDTINEDPFVEQEARQAGFEVAPTSGTVLDSAGRDSGDDIVANTKAGNGDSTTVDDVSGTKSQSRTTTETDERDRQTCIVFEKPIVRKRRSLLRKHRH